VSIDPPDSSTHELTSPHELHHFVVWDRARPVNQRVRLEQPSPPRSISDQELTVDEIVAQHLVGRQELVESARKGLPAGQETDPDRGVDEDHYATRRLRAGFSRRRGASRTVGSEPNNARRRSYAPWRRSASSPKRTASVSVVAPLTFRASASSWSSMWSVFFIRTLLPYLYGRSNQRDDRSGGGRGHGWSSSPEMGQVGRRHR